MAAFSLGDLLKKGYSLQKGVLVKAETPLVGKVTPATIKCPISPTESIQRLVLPYPPSSNRLYGVNPKTGQRFLLKEGRAYHDAIKRIGVELGLKPLEGDLIFSMWLYRPRKAGDIQNFQKQFLDSLEGVIYHNDRQIRDLHAYRMDDKEDPRVEIEVVPC